jgi:hypothetical protein
VPFVLFDQQRELAQRHRGAMLRLIAPCFLEDDLATPAREITSRHRVDRRSLLPLAARDAVAVNATSSIALEADVLFDGDFQDAFSR